MIGQPSQTEPFVYDDFTITPAWGNFINSIYLQMTAESSFTIPNYLAHTGDRVGFYGTTPVIQASAITAPTGGATVDAQARTAIGSILTALSNVGITA